MSDYYHRSSKHQSDNRRKNKRRQQQSCQLDRFFHVCIIIPVQRILFIAPLPPPITGQSIVSQKLYENLLKQYDVIPLDYSKPTFRSGITSIGRIFEILNLLRRIRKYRRNVDLVYLNISQSIAGNVKDLLAILLCNRPRVVLHLHGGGLDRQVYQKSNLLKWLNRLVMKSIGRVVVLGESLRPIFHDIIPDEKIVVIENFADEHLFLEKNEIEKKFRQGRRTILFLSNMIQEKGYNVLFQAVKKIPAKDKAKLRVVFIGRFDNAKEQSEFITKVEAEPVITCIGPVSGIKRRKFLKEAQIFCLPTYYPFEGQPLTILESYAAACCVITTNIGGIADIFTPGENGFSVKARSVEDLKATILHCLDMSNESLYRIGLANFNMAKRRFRESRFVYQMKEVFRETIQI